MTEQDEAAVQKAVTEKDALLPPEKSANTEKDAVYVPLRDQKFRIKDADDVPLWALMEFAAADDISENMAGIYRIIQSIVHEDDFTAFRKFAMNAKPRLELEDFYNFQNAAYEALSANPTKQPGTSSDGSSGTGGTSAGSSRRRKAATQGS